MTARVPESLMVITDRRLVVDLAGALAARLATAAAGSCLVQLREKELPDAELMALGTQLLAVARAHGARLVVNGRVAVARAIGADGVHLPEGLSVPEAREALGPDALVGASCHDVESVATRVEEGADLVTLGPIWDTPSKRGMGQPLGLEPPRLAADRLGGRAALFALGGIETPTRAAEARAAGAHGVAGIRAFLLGPEPLRAFSGRGS